MGNDKGQYFTTNTFLQNAVYKLIHNNPSRILEPSIGRGDLVDYIKNVKPEIVFDMYEIDETIDVLNSIKKEQVIYGDFLTQNISIKYDTIVGNPPYVKTKGLNLYLQFIDACYELLNDGGELIFIVPSDFIKLTSSRNIIDKMMSHGTFTHIIHPNDETLFAKASVDVIVFRYCKDGSLSNKIMLNENEKYLVNSKGVLTFSDTQQTYTETFSDYFDIHVGMVTGKEDVFKNTIHGNIELLNGKDKIDKYILIEKFPTGDKALDEYMLSHKQVLMDRKIKKITEENWHTWGALRNIETIRKRKGEKCIYVKNITRSNEVCFEGTVQYFGGGLIILIPKKKFDIKKVIDYMNSDVFKSNYMYSGRFKIGHRQLENAFLQPPDSL